MAKQTIRLYLILTFLTDFSPSFFSATYAMFLISHGLNLFEVNLVNLAFFTTLFLFEIPTGAVADVFGRKASFVISCFLYALGMFIYAVSGSFWFFVLAEIIAAIGCTFASGAFEAWLVDRLRHHGFEGELSRVFSKEQQVSRAASVVGAVLGAYLSNFNLALPWVLAGFVMIAAGVLAILSMREEYFARKSLSFREGVANVKETTLVAVRYGLNDRVVRFILVIGLIHFFSVQALNMQWQPFFLPYFSNRTGLGYIYAGISLSLMIGAAFAPRFLRMMKSERKAIIASTVIIGSAMAASVSFEFLPIILFFFFAHEAGRGLFSPLKDAYLNDNIPSKERATIISFESISHHVGGAIGLVVSGFLAEYFFIPFAWIFSGAVLVFFGLWFLKSNGGLLTRRVENNPSG